MYPHLKAFQTIMYTVTRQQRQPAFTLVQPATYSNVHKIVCMFDYTEVEHRSYA